MPLPAPPPVAITYPPRPHVALPAYWTLLNQRSDHAWLAADPLGRKWILERHEETWHPMDGYRTRTYDSLDPWSSDDYGYGYGL
jgi:hypothetical protein